MTINSQAFDPKEFEERIISKAQADATYRRRLLSNAKAVFEEELGQKLPEDVEVHTLQQSLKKLYLLLPLQINELACAENLSDEELESLAGGGISTAMLSLATASNFSISGSST